MLDRNGHRIGKHLVSSISLCWRSSHPEVSTVSLSQDSASSPLTQTHLVQQPASPACSRPDPPGWSSRTLEELRVESRGPLRHQEVVPAACGSRAERLTEKINTNLFKGCGYRNCVGGISFPRGNTPSIFTKKISHSSTSSNAQYYFPTANYLSRKRHVTS